VGFVRGLSKRSQLQSPSVKFRLIYAMLRHGQEYADRGQDYFEERYSQRVLHNIAQKAMAMQLVPSDNTA
jgi:transposase